MVVNTQKGDAERNIGMTFDFIRQIIEHPAIIDTIQDNAELDFIDKDMPENYMGLLSFLPFLTNFKF